jgi:hypothetical protein
MRSERYDNRRRRSSSSTGSCSGNPKDPVRRVVPHRRPDLGDGTGERERPGGVERGPRSQPALLITASGPSAREPVASNRPPPTQLSSPIERRGSKAADHTSAASSNSGIAAAAHALAESASG